MVGDTHGKRFPADLEEREGAGNYQRHHGNVGGHDAQCAQGQIAAEREPAGADARTDQVTGDQIA